MGEELVLIAAKKLHKLELESAMADWLWEKFASKWVSVDDLREEVEYSTGLTHEMLDVFFGD